VPTYRLCPRLVSVSANIFRKLVTNYLGISFNYIKQAVARILAIVENVFEFLSICVQVVFDG
jgi:hypothetical protein